MIIDDEELEALREALRELLSRSEWWLMQASKGETTTIPPEEARLLVVRCERLLDLLDDVTPRE